jgi:UDP-N-acetyl-D-glucosamine dehydrogenase
MLEVAFAPSAVESFLSKVQTRNFRVGIIGLGYVGLPLSLLFSEQKFRVTGFDVDQQKVDTLAAGGSYIYRILPEEIAAAKASGFSATTDWGRIADLHALIICVPTPLNEHYEPDLRSLSLCQHQLFNRR